MSRCGSTLVAQLFSSLSDCVVLSEPPPLDALLRGGPEVDQAQRAQWIEWLVGALARPRSGGETRCFLKLDCWHMPYLPLLRRALPDVPWIFVYRDPLEVLASHQAGPALWSVPGMLDPEWIGADFDGVVRMDRIEYCARVLEKVCQSALHFSEDGSRKLVNYTELPEAAWTGVAKHFGMTLTAAEIAAMQAKSGFHAKSPGIHFQSDWEAKRREATARTVALAEQFLYPLYERLERARLSRIEEHQAGEAALC